MYKWRNQLGWPETQGRHGFLLVLIIDAFGAGLFVPLSILYFQVTTDLPLSAIGLTLTSATVCALPVSLLTGSLVDRFGARRITAISQLIQAIGFLGYLFVHTVPVFFIMALLVTTGGRIFFAASASLIVDIATPHELARWFGLVGVIRNVGLGIGGLLAGIVLATHNPDIYHMLIGVSALCYLLAASLLLHLSEPGQRDHEQVEKVPYKAILQHRQFIFFLISSISFPLCSMMLGTAFLVYVTEAVHAPDWLPGPALLLNSLLVIGCQTFLVRLMEPFRRTRTLGVAALMWGISCGCFALALFIPSFLVAPYLFLVVAIHTLASILYGPTTSSLVAELGPVALRGRYLATYEFSWGVASALTPALFSNLYVVTPSLPWLFLAGLVSMSGASLLWLERRLPVRVVWAKKQDGI